MLEIKRWTKVEEIHQLKALQDKNLKSKINQAEQKSEGFLTASYSVEFLTQMNQLHPAILAKDSNFIQKTPLESYVLINYLLMGFFWSSNGQEEQDGKQTRFFWILVNFCSMSWRKY